MTHQTAGILTRVALYTDILHFNNITKIQQAYKLNVK